MEIQKNITQEQTADIKTIPGLNYKKKIKLRFKKTDNFGYSIYLDLWHNGKRHYEFLNLYVEGKKSTLQEDKKILQQACGMRDQKEKELQDSKASFALTNKKEKMNFINFFKTVAEEKKHHNWWSCLKHLTKFSGTNITFKNVDIQFCNDFKDYLEKNLHKNSANSYFKKFKSSLNIAVQKKLLVQNPAQQISIGTTEVKREFLTFEELQHVTKVPASDDEVKNAFLFSCFSGLRISELQELTFRNINKGYLEFPRDGEQGANKMRLHLKAQEIIKEQSVKRNYSENGKVFLLPRDSVSINKIIKSWMAASGIQKGITFNCARHTFATICLSFGVDIYTVSKLLGHRNLKTTEIYAELVGKQKDEVVDKLPGYDTLFHKFISRDSRQIEFEFEKTTPR